MASIGRYVPPVARNPKQIVHLPSAPPQKGVRTDLCRFHPALPSYEPHAKSFGAQIVSCSFGAAPNGRFPEIPDVTLHLELSDGRIIPARDFFSGIDMFVLENVYIAINKLQVGLPHTPRAIWPRRALFGQYIPTTSKNNGDEILLLAACVAERAICPAILQTEESFFNQQGFQTFDHKKDFFVRLEGPQATSIMFTPPGFFTPKS